MGTSFHNIQLVISLSGADPGRGGVWGRARLPKIGEKKFTRNTPKIFAQTFARRNFFLNASPHSPNLKSWIRPCLLYSIYSVYSNSGISSKKSKKGRLDIVARHSNLITVAKRKIRFQLFTYRCYLFYGYFLVVKKK